MAKDSEEVKLIIKASTDQATQQLVKLNKNFDETAKKGTKLGKVFNNARKHWLGLAIAVTGTALVVRKGFDISKEAAEYKQSVQAMENQFSVSSDKIIAKLKESSGGTIANKDLVLSANKSMALGVTRDQEKMGKLMEFARLRARAMGLDTTQAFSDIVTGIGRNSPLILDNLGLITKGWAKEAQAAGKAYDSQFILNKVLAQAGTELSKVGKLVETDAERIQRMSASIDNASVKIGAVLLPILNTTTTALADMAVWFGSLSEVMQKSIIRFSGAAVAIAVLTKVVTVFGVSMRAAFWWVTAIATAVAAGVAVYKNWDTVLWGLKVAWEAVSFAFDVAVQGFKVGIQWIATNALKATEFLAKPFIVAIDTMIEGLNRLPGVQISTLDSMFNKQIAQNEAMLELEQERLDAMHMATVEDNVRQEETAIAQNQKLLDGAQAKDKGVQDSQKKTEEFAVASFATQLNLYSSMISQMSAINSMFYGNQIKELENNKKAHTTSMQEKYLREKATLEDILAKVKSSSEQNLALERKTKEQLRRLNSNYTSSLKSAESGYNSQIRSLRRRQAQHQKRLAIVSATVNTAQSVTMALAQGGFILGPIMAAVMAAMGAVQINLIKKQPIPAAQEGGLIRGVPGSAGQLIRAGENNQSEAIIPLENEEAMEKIGGLGGSSIVFNIETLFANEDFPEEIALKIDRALFKLQQQGLSKI